MDRIGHALGFSGDALAPGDGGGPEECTAVWWRSQPAADPPSAAVFWLLDSRSWRSYLRRFEGPETPGKSGAMENTGIRAGQCLTASTCGSLQQIFRVDELEAGV